MKKNHPLLIPYYIVVACITGLFSSCENEIPYTPGIQTPQLIMNALLDAGETENFVYLSLSGAQSIGYVKQATVALYLNGEHAEELEELPLLLPPYPDSLPDNYLEELPDIYKRKQFRMQTRIRPGDRVRLEAKAENGQYHVTAEVTVPQPLASIQVDTALAVIKNEGLRDTYRQFKVTMQDIPNEKNYYRLDIRRDVSTSGQWSQEKDTTITNRYTKLINREDVVLTDGRPMSSDDEDMDMFGTYIENIYNVFPDHRFANSHYTLKVYTDQYDNAYAAFTSSQIRIARTITVRLLSITEATYRYLKALNCLTSDYYDETLMEPIIIPSNVTGGLGFVGVSSETRVTMQLPDEIIDLIYAK